MNWPTYDPDTGRFTQVADRQAGTLETKGYRQIRVGSKRYKAHRIAWFLMTGKWPKHQIDHINGDKDDNRWCNLREATNAENKQNAGLRADNTSGYKCVTRVPEKWRVVVDMKHCGYFDSLLDAATCANWNIAYRHGEFAQLNQLPEGWWGHD